MNLKKMTIILLILMLLLVPITFAKDGDFKIPSVVKDITVEKDGSTVITEKIVYDVEGTVNGVYRDIPLKGNQSLSNVSVETPGYYNELEIEKNRSKTKLKVWLYNDEAKTQKTKNAKVEVTYKYTINKGVKIYNDIAEIQYMTWGSEWNTKVDNMESNIHIPGSKDNIQYWNNPEDNVVSSQWTSQDTLTTKLKDIPAKTSFEQRIIMPKDYFQNATHAQIVNIDAKDKIIENQKKYKEEHERANLYNTIYLAIIGLFCLLPVGVYLKYGREPKIDYNAEYEYDIPSEDTPVQVNAIMTGDVGELDTDAISATVLDLINRKYFKIMVNDATDTIIRQTDKDTSDLKDHEKTLIAFFSKYAENGDISIGSVGNRKNHYDFQSFRQTFYKQAKQEIPESFIQKYFDNQGHKWLKRIAGIFLLMIVVSFAVLFLGLLPPTQGTMFVASLAFFFLGALVLFLMPNTLAGRWTKEGKETHEKWKGFQRYLKDYSLIEERPPASVQIWGKYLIYASALGCAGEVTKNMKQFFNSRNFSDDYFGGSDAVSFAYYNGFAHVESSFTTLSQSDSDYDSGGIGSSGGGGFGGGGGGTF